MPQGSEVRVLTSSLKQQPAQAERYMVTGKAIVSLPGKQFVTQWMGRTQAVVFNLQASGNTRVSTANTANLIGHALMLFYVFPH